MREKSLKKLETTFKSYLGCKSRIRPLQKSFRSWQKSNVGEGALDVVSKIWDLKIFMTPYRNSLLSCSILTGFNAGSSPVGAKQLWRLSLIHLEID